MRARPWLVSSVVSTPSTPPTDGSAFEACHDALDGPDPEPSIHTRSNESLARSADEETGKGW